jgi:hypothetical protein
MLAMSATEAIFAILCLLFCMPDEQQDPHDLLKCLVYCRNRWSGSGPAGRTSRWEGKVLFSFGGLGTEGSGQGSKLDSSFEDLIAG